MAPSAQILSPAVCRVSASAEVRAQCLHSSRSLGPQPSADEERRVGTQRMPSPTCKAHPRESPPVCTLTQTPEESLLGLLLSLAFWAGLMGLGRGLGWGVEEASRNQAAPRARGLQG